MFHCWSGLASSLVSSTRHITVWSSEYVAWTWQKILSNVQIILELKKMPNYHCPSREARSQTRFSLSSVNRCRFGSLAPPYLCKFSARWFLSKRKKLNPVPGLNFSAVFAMVHLGTNCRYLSGLCFRRGKQNLAPSVVAVSQPSWFMHPTRWIGNTSYMRLQRLLVASTANSTRKHYPYFQSNISISNLIKRIPCRLFPRASSASEGPSEIPEP